MKYTSKLIFLFFILPIFLDFTSCTFSDVQKNQPNIIFIMVDDLGKEWISCYGADSIRTPSIDQMAAEGMMFHNAWSMPQCTPTRVTLLTGKYPWKTGWVNHWDVPRWGHGYFDWKHYKTFATYLKQAGYKTAAAGKWQINDFRLTPDAMAKHGFDDWCMWTGYEEGVPASRERYWDPYIHTRDGSKTYLGEFGTDVFTAFLVNFMRKNKEHPMMLYYPMALTHGPMTSTPDEPDVTGMERHKAMVRYTDKQVGIILGELKNLGIAENTLVIFTTDNGSSRGITGSINGRAVEGGKGTKWETGVCEPFIAKWPGEIASGSETYAITDFTDLLPTFLEAAGIDRSEDDLDGYSFLSVLLGNAQDTPREWIMALGHGPACLDENGVRGIDDFADRVIRDKTYKVWIDQNREIVKLYNLLQDPFEEHNLLEAMNENDSKALDKFKTILSGLPEKDARPAYDKRTQNVWDTDLLKCPAQSTPKE